MPALTLALLLAAHSPEECVAASDQGQELRRAGKLAAAKLAFETCSEALCPQLVRSACTEWLDGVHNETPTLIVVARVDGTDQTSAHVTLDGQPWLEALTGTAQPLDPGEHELHVDAQGLAQSQRLVVNAGEKNRRVVFELHTPVKPTPPPPPPPSITPPVVLSVAAAAGLALFAGFGLAGRVTQGQLLGDPCAATMTCDPSRVISLRALYVVADLTLALGIVAVGLAAWRWWLYLH